MDIDTVWAVRSYSKTFVYASLTKKVSKRSTFHVYDEVDVTPIQGYVGSIQLL